MSFKKYPLVLIGGSIASISFIRTLRESGNSEKILLVYGEDRLPYKRTKINKNMVRGFDKNEFIIADKDWYDENNVDLLNEWASSIDLKKKEVLFNHHDSIGYGKLLLATGAAPVVPKISGIATEEMYRVQNALDVERLLAETKQKRRFLIIGGGVEGIETADQLIRKEKQVILAGRMKYPLQKYFPHEFVEPLEQDMIKKGIDYYSGVSITNIHKTGEGYETKIKGQLEKFDAVVACSGAIPNIYLAEKAGLKTEMGIMVDEWMHTSDPHVLAAGDVAQHKNGMITGLWHAAEHQGKQAAINLYSHTEKHVLPPYRLKTEVFGNYLFSARYEILAPNEYEIVKERDNKVMRWFYFQNNRLKAALMLNDGQRAKIYQQALMEEWTKEKTERELPLKPPLAFSFSPSS